jgi:hypothetical protein
MMKEVHCGFYRTPKNMPVWAREIYRTTGTTLARLLPEMNEFWLWSTTVPSDLWPLNMQLYKPKSLLTVWRFATICTLAGHNGTLNNMN